MPQISCLQGAAPSLITLSKSMSPFSIGDINVKGLMGRRFRSEGDFNGDDPVFMLLSINQRKPAFFFKLFPPFRQTAHRRLPILEPPCDICGGHSKLSMRPETEQGSGFVSLRRFPKSCHFIGGHAHDSATREINQLKSHPWAFTRTFPQAPPSPSGVHFPQNRYPKEFAHPS